LKQRKKQSVKKKGPRQRQGKKKALPTPTTRDKTHRKQDTHSICVCDGKEATIEGEGVRAARSKNKRQLTGGGITPCKNLEQQKKREVNRRKKDNHGGLRGPRPCRPVEIGEGQKRGVSQPGEVFKNRHECRGRCRDWGCPPSAIARKIVKWRNKRKQENMKAGSDRQVSEDPRVWGGGRKSKSGGLERKTGAKIPKTFVIQAAWLCHVE